jgi:hypothetical protein
MRPVRPIHLLLVPAFFLAGCDDTSLPYEPETGPIEAPVALAGAARWAAGYLHAGSPTAASYAPVPYLSYNASGGAMNVTKPAGTTGRYIVTFSGLSAELGSKNTVHVTEYGLDDTYCKPVNGRLVSDKLEVRCFRASTRAAANAAFTVVVLGRSSDAAFAYAHQATSTGYAAAAGGTYNPAGATTVYRTTVGRYEVVFANLAKDLPSTAAGHVQVNAVGTGKAHCILEDWGRQGTTPNVQVEVRCYTPAGVMVDSKFTVIFQRPAGHLAYTFANLETNPSYSPFPLLTSNPGGGVVTITRGGVGDYTVDWGGVDPQIIEGGTVHVTSASAFNQCKATGLFQSGVIVHCFGPTGAPADAPFGVLLGS